MPRKTSTTFICCQVRDKRNSIVTATLFNGKTYQVNETITTDDPKLIKQLEASDSWKEGKQKTKVPKPKIGDSEHQKAIEKAVKQREKEILEEAGVSSMEELKLKTSSTPEPVDEPEKSPDVE